MGEIITRVLEEQSIQTGSFRNQWLNFSLYLPQFLYKTKRKPSKSKVCLFFISDKVNRLKGNDQPLGGGQTNTIFLANGDNYQTSFINVNKDDIITMLQEMWYKKGYHSDELSAIEGQEYKRSTGTGNSSDPVGRKYFFRGLGMADCLKFLLDKNIL